MAILDFESPEVVAGRNDFDLMQHPYKNNQLANLFLTVSCFKLCNLRSVDHFADEIEFVISTISRNE
jgi:hypothetical protein